jgi:hypothetical protein
MGALANINTANAFVKFISNINPIKYAAEGVFRRSTNNIQTQIIVVKFNESYSKTIEFSQ